MRKAHGLMLTLVLALIPAIGLSWSSDRDDKDKDKNRDRSRKERRIRGVLAPGGSNFAWYFGDDSAYLGVLLEEETEDPEGGARVTQVVDDSPAAEAGIREGDVIVGFDGEMIRGPVGLTRRIHEREPGQTYSICPGDSPSKACH